MSTGDAVLLRFGFEVLLGYGTMKLKMYCMMTKKSPTLCRGFGGFIRSGFSCVSSLLL
jgi:hypothetical protein